jgi:hypothetical protein
MFMQISELLSSLILSAAISTTVVFTSGLATAENSTLVGSPNTTVADGVSSLSLLFSARDSHNNFTPGVNVSLTASGVQNVFNTSSGTTDGSGKFYSTLSSTVAQSETITANFGNGNSLVAVVVFTPGPPSANTSTFAVSPNSTIANNSNSLIGTLTLKDAKGNVIEGVIPSFSASGTSTTISSSGSTSAIGQASATYRTSLAQSENALVLAAGITKTAPMIFTAGPATAANSTLTASPNMVAANGAASISLIATVNDAQGNAVSNASIALSASGGNTTFGAANGTTLSSGTYMTTVMSSQVQTETVTARISNAFNKSTPVSFSAPAQCTLAISPSSQPADGNSTLTLTTTVTNNSNQPVPGSRVSLSSSGAAQQFTIQNPVTNASGQAVSKVTSLYAGNNKFKAQATSAQCAGQGNFVVRTPYCSNNPNFAISTYVTGSIPVDVTSADFNNDSNQDLAVVNSGDDTVSIFLSAGGGAFQPKTDYPTGSGPTGITNGDFDGDGNQDLVIVNGSERSLSVFLGTGPGTFRPQVTYATGNAPSGITIGDFNGDGKQDLAVANNDQTVGIFLGNGSGGFQAQVAYAAGGSPYAITTGDFNGDGKQDLAVVNGSGNTVGIYLGTGSGTFQTQVTYATGSAPNAVTTGDFNGDGNQDMAVVNYNNNTLGVFLGTGTGTFQAQVTYPSGSGPNDIVVGDFNGDGKQDLAVTNFGDNTISLFLGNGSSAGATFRTQVTYGTGGGPYNIITNDINGDAKQDLIVTDYSSDTVEVFRTMCP